LDQHELRRLPRRVDVWRGQRSKLGHKAPHIGAVRVEFGALEHRVEDAEIRGCVGARACYGK